MSPVDRQQPPSFPFEAACSALENNGRPELAADIRALVADATNAAEHLRVLGDPNGACPADGIEPAREALDRIVARVGAIRAAALLMRPLPGQDLNFESPSPPRLPAGRPRERATEAVVVSMAFGANP